MKLPTDSLPHLENLGLLVSFYFSLGLKHFFLRSHHHEKGNLLDISLTKCDNVLSLLASVMAKRVSPLWSLTYK